MTDTQRVLLEMRGITKRFPGVVANRGIDLDVRVGEIHGLLGENGAGKTTLMKVLFGLLRPDEGTISIRNQIATIRSPKDAVQLGIGMVHQHFMLVPDMTVSENLALGVRSRPVSADPAEGGCGEGSRAVGRARSRGRSGRLH